MASTTETKVLAGSPSRARLLGLACLIGGLLWLPFVLAGAYELPLGGSVVEGLLGVVMLLGLMGGPLGLLYLRAAGSGRLGRAGAVVALAGLGSYLIGHALQTVLGLATSEVGVFYAAGTFFVGLGMLPLGIAVLMARELAGWRSTAPLLVGLYYVAMIPVQIVFFIGPDGQPSLTLLAFWGLAWALLGYAIFEEARGGRT